MAGTEDKTQDQVKVKITVGGQEKEVTQQELIELAQKGDDYTKKTQELAEKERTLEAEKVKVVGLKAIVDEMEGDPKLKEALNKVYSEYKSGRISKSDDVKDRNLKKLDKLIDETNDPGEREKLRDIRDIIRQESPDTKPLEEKIAKLEQELSGIKEATLIGQTSNIESKLTKLEEEYGSELVGKHRKDILALALKYPRQEVENMLLHLADKTEVRTALLNQAKKKEKEELERKKRGSSASGTESSFTAKSELKKDKAGRVTFDTLKERILERLGKK